jgi:L-aminopeptidase/D-esterase-like protein
MRAREAGIPLGGEPGRQNAITDVPGVTVGMVTLLEDRPNGVAVRTGVTAVLPLGRAGVGTTVPAGIHVLNGNGELTGAHWIGETGALTGPVMLTNTHAVGPVHRGVIDWTVANRPDRAIEWLLPVVAETWDGYLNSINEDAVRTEHAARAIDAAESGPVAEGSAGGGTGMNCYEFSGGTGTASRMVSFGAERYTVGVLVQANFGSRDELRVAGVPMGDLDAPNPIAEPWFAADRDRAAPGGAGSVIAVIATDAPLIPQQCQALARRAPLGLARTGTTGSHFSGDIFLAFSTGNPGSLDSGFPVVGGESLRSLRMVPWNGMDRFYAAVVESVEEAVLNALVENVDMTGRDGHWVPRLPVDQVQARLTPPDRSAS